ncbi:integration host factor subunit alpha [Actinobacillus indolicus]|uniref:Integration host factor subunit alpha n=1 Tax=Actinobacillus indolicus TaxID=51049 RepID=A0A4P7CNA9_9PAST|nr:integration host factor subunit alpha [Actinobacillus indolicus]QBQ64631.1 integration host factor subunit alpha [Actinobacillus indolicus]VFY95510.1 integration host factor subunit alpha [Actinobacillus indolicus]VTU08507.1 integration host factor subunit alpha [Actinobacillus indolicus]
MALTKIEIAENLVEKFGLDKRIAKQFVEDFFEEIRQSLEKGEEVKLSGFGNFTVRDKKARPGRNPKTGEDVAVSARRVVVFKPGQKLRERVETAKVKA